ncbi:MAG: hypothetical protein AAF512_01360 [Pseudomonadota bacterium]
MTNHTLNAIESQLNAYETGCDTYDVMYGSVPDVDDIKASLIAESKERDSVASEIEAEIYEVLTGQRARDVYAAIEHKGENRARMLQILPAEGRQRACEEVAQRAWQRALISAYEGDCEPLQTIMDVVLDSMANIKHDELMKAAEEDSEARQVMYAD